MTHLLFPGRHHLLTNYQLEYLTRLTSGNPETLADVDGKPLGTMSRVGAILWAVTSANHSNTRRNPLPSHRREVAIEAFSTQLDADSYVYMIDDIGTTPRFADYVLKKIEVDSQGQFQLTPENAIVACSTPEVIDMYEQLGFRVLPVELQDRSLASFHAETPWQLVEAIIRAGEEGRDWRYDETFVGKVARATRRLYLKYGYGDVIIDLHRSLTLGHDGDLTETRDYNSYARSFDAGAKRKYDLVKDHVLPGRIVDIGCCTGAFIRELALDDRFRESDLYGVEIARHLYAECLHRKEQNAFANDHVFFYHKDFAAEPMFTANSVTIFSTFSLTHEIESYAGSDALSRFLSLLYDQLAIGGRWINLDVVGPNNLEELVYLWLNTEDGRNSDYDRAFGSEQRAGLKQYLDGLSTFARFLRFANDFRQEEGYQLPYHTEVIHGTPHVTLSMQDACEFISKKDYTDNWQSEMHERFCFWNFAQWKQAVMDAGFRVRSASRAFTNPWLVENRYRGKVEFFRRASGQLQAMDDPATNLLLVAEKA